MRKSHRLAVVVGAVAAALAVPAAYGLASTATRSADAIVRVSAMSEAGRGSVPQGLRVWLEPDASLTANGTMTGDGRIVAETRGLSGNPQVADLGAGVDATLVRAGRTPIVMVTGYDGSVRVLAYDDSAGRWSRILTLDEEPTALTAYREALAYASPDNHGQVVIVDKFDEVSTIDLPPAPDATDDNPVSGYKGPFVDGDSVVVTSLLSLEDRLLAFASNGHSSYVADIATGVTKPLAGSTEVCDASAGPDGLIYAATLGERGETIKILLLDPESLNVMSTADSAWSSSEGSGPPRLNRLRLLPLESEVVLFVAELPAHPAVVAPTHLWRVASDMIQEISSPPEGSGIDVSWGRDGSLLLAGGPAASDVSRFDLGTETITSGVESRSPEGTWMLVVAE